MYNLGDSSYLKQPKFMDQRTVNSIITRVREYVTANHVKGFQFIFHGGEPLLAPQEWYKYFTSRAKSELPDIQLSWSLQTNGVLYDDTWASLLKELHINVGFSWDGPRDVHDKFRVFHNGKGSYDHVINAMNVHRKYHGYVGALSVINSEIPAKEYYDCAKNIGITDFTLLLPQLHYSMSKEHQQFDYNPKDATFGKWLCELYDAWWKDADETKPNITYFTDFMQALLGHKRSDESFGDSENTVLVIETNGDIETSTALKSCGDGFTKEGNNISSTSIESAVEKSPLIQLFINSHKKLCKTCTECQIVELCGGGRINERFSEKNAFDNPSIYCDDIKLIVTHIQHRMLETIDQNELHELGLELLKWDEA